MERLRQIINEAVRSALTSLDEARSIKSKKLQSIVSQYGGIYRSDGRMGRFKHHGDEYYHSDLHNIGDEDVIGVLDSRMSENIWRNRGLWQEYANKNGIKLGPTDVIERVRLADGEHYAMLVVRRYNSNDDPVGLKRDERSYNRRYVRDGKIQYCRPSSIKKGNGQPKKG